MAEKVGEVHLDAQLAMQATRLDERRSLRSIRCPTLIVSARQDALCSVARHVEMNHLIGSSTLAILETAVTCLRSSSRARSPSTSPAGGRLNSPAPRTRPLGHGRKPAGGELRSLGQRRQLGVDDLRVNRTEAGEGGEAAVRAGDHPVGAHQIHEASEPVGHDVRVLDEVRRRVDHARDQHLVVGDAVAVIGERLEVVLVPRIGRLEEQARRLAFSSTGKIVAISTSR